MKTNIKVVISAIVFAHITLNCSQKLLAQCLSNQNTWQSQLNTIGNTGKNKFGTCDNFPINIFTNGTQKATILTNGFFGLGTPNPQSLLHLKGGQVAYLQISNDHTAAFGDQGFSLGLDVNGIAEFIQRHDSPISFKLRNIPGNAIIERLTILNNGNVGIGTPNPIC